MLWHCAFVCALVLCVWVLFIGPRRPSLVANTSIELSFIEVTTQSNRSVIQIEKERGTKRRIHIPKFMLDLYEERKREDDGVNFSKADVVRSVIPKNAGTLQNSEILESYDEQHLLIFDLPSSNKDERFFNAELRILTLVTVDSTNGVSSALNFKTSFSGVERIIKVSFYNESASNLRLLDERHVYHSDNTWIRFNMTGPVDHLLGQQPGQRLLKLVVSITALVPYLNYNKEHFRLSLLPVTEDVNHDYPILLLSYMSAEVASKARRKRSIEDDYEEETNKLWDNDQQDQQGKAQAKKLKRLKNTCRRRQLYIDFAEIQYDAWIVQPSGYEAYQCAGKCFYPVAEHLSPTKHAIVQALLHSVAPSRAPRSCCVPSKLDSISLLYVDEKGVLTYRYEYKDMVVLECGCR